MKAPLLVAKMVDNWEFQMVARLEILKVVKMAEMLEHE